MNQFQTFGLPETVLNALEKCNFTAPTPVQEMTIPPILEGKDVIGYARTGTGKTGAFGIPMVSKIILGEIKLGLIVAPTRELARQVQENIRLFTGMNSGRKKCKTALLIGGEGMFHQRRQLQSKPSLIVGTPGRINDHIQSGTLDLSKTEMLVLDEMDRMLDDGFLVQIERIMKSFDRNPQTLLFSATPGPNTENFIKKYMDNPEIIGVTDSNKPVEKIVKETLYVREDEKYDTLLEALDNRTGSILIFMKTKFSTEKLAKKLLKEKHSSAALHGGMRQNKRDKVIADFRALKKRILIATDVAARGLDIPHIEHVINYDLPQCPEDYIHRIGRTARAGAEGNALALVTDKEKSKWRAIERLLDPESFAHEKGRNNDGFKKPKRNFGKKKFFGSPSGKPNYGNGSRRSGPSRGNRKAV